SRCFLDRDALAQQHSTAAASTTLWHNVHMELVQFDNLNLSSPGSRRQNLHRDHWTGPAPFKPYDYDPHKFDPIYIEDPLRPGNNVGRNCFRIMQLRREDDDMLCSPGSARSLSFADVVVKQFQQKSAVPVTPFPATSSSGERQQQDSRPMMEDNVWVDEMTKRGGDAHAAKGIAEDKQHALEFGEFRRRLVLWRDFTTDAYDNDT
ncbi:hypothetical protein DYB26_006653, partial [Aphanomyces astaci]